MGRPKRITEEAIHEEPSAEEILTSVEAPKEESSKKEYLGENGISYTGELVIVGNREFLKYSKDGVTYLLHEDKTSGLWII